MFITNPTATTRKVLIESTKYCFSIYLFYNNFLIIILLLIKDKKKHNEGRKIDNEIIRV